MLVSGARLSGAYLLEYGYSFNVTFNGFELKGWLAERDWNASSIYPDIGNVYADLIRQTCTVKGAPSLAANT